MTIRSKPVSPEYAANYDNIFRKEKEPCKHLHWETDFMSDSRKCLDCGKRVSYYDLLYGGEWK
jgi:hypothetical protein